MQFIETKAQLDRAEKLIPFGSQTFSKSKMQFPGDNVPLFCERGFGGRVEDVDGNEFVDLICGLLPIILGYDDIDIKKAILEQLENGITFSLSTKRETELAEILVELIPCAEMVKFGKNGTDATSAAVRLARAYTSRDKIISIGYHGWQDWYIGATSRSKGVPKIVGELTLRAPYNDLDALHLLFQRNKSEIAAIIMEPMKFENPIPGYLENVKQLAHQHGALLIYDEVITGFRFSLGGAQKYFSVTPDLAAFGKAMGNGMPISAVVGSERIMREMEEIFYSGTFGGEALSIAASIAVINKMKKHPVIENIWSFGDLLATKVEQEINSCSLSEAIQLGGKAPWKIINFKNYNGFSSDKIKTFFIHQMINEGILIQSSHNICYAHDDNDFKKIVTAYERVLPSLAQKIQDKSLDDFDVPTIRPVFSVR